MGLVSIRPAGQVAVARVAPPGYRVAAGDPVVTVGCNNGDDPTAAHCRVLAVDKFRGPHNLQVEGEPVEGRSGGGVFSSDGMVVGICNAADRDDHAGLLRGPAHHLRGDGPGQRGLRLQGGAQGDVVAGRAGRTAVAAAALRVPSVAGRGGQAVRRGSGRGGQVGPRRTGGSGTKSNDAARTGPRSCASSTAATGKARAK